MATKSAAEQTGIARIVFREILSGDRRKFIAQSNDAETGGGARDIRFRGWADLEPILRQLFPGVRTTTRKRGGSSVTEQVFVGQFNWEDVKGDIFSQEAVLETPTDARPAEARLAKVHQYECFQSLPPQQGNGRLLLLFGVAPLRWTVCVSGRLDQTIVSPFVFDRREIAQRRMAA